MGKLIQHNPAQVPTSSKWNKLLDSTWFNFTGSSSTGLAPWRSSGVDSKVLAQLGTALLQPKCSISSRASPWEKRCGTMVSCFSICFGPLASSQIRSEWWIKGWVSPYVLNIHSSRHLWHHNIHGIYGHQNMVTRIIKQGVGEPTCTGHSGSVLPLGHPQHHNIIQYPWHWWSPE